VETLISGDKTKSTLERLLAKEVTVYQTNIYKIMEKLEKETKWLLDEEQKINPDRVVRYS